MQEMLREGRARAARAKERSGARRGGGPGALVCGVGAFLGAPSVLCGGEGGAPGPRKVRKRFRAGSGGGGKVGTEGVGRA